jgi:hypothetical protein
MPVAPAAPAGRLPYQKQPPVGDEFAIAFSEKLYERLAEQAQPLPGVSLPRLPGLCAAEGQVRGGPAAHLR